MRLIRRKAEPTISTVLADASQAETERQKSARVMAEANATIRRLNDELIKATHPQTKARAEYMERVAELVEARQMAGSGPWSVPDAVLKQTDRLISEAQEKFATGGSLMLKETSGLAQLDLNVMLLGDGQWRRELNWSQMEFSRWGIQQIILMTRLRYIKNPIIRRLVDVTAAYIFARGVETSCQDPDANAVLDEFFEDNKRTLGQIAMVDLQRRKSYDGNNFHVLFADKTNTGKVRHRTFDPLEIQEIACDPEDADTPWYYLREWSQQGREEATGELKPATGKAWYPDINYEPEGGFPATWGGIPVVKDAVVLHRKCGGIGKWKWGLPEAYPALGHAVESVKYLSRFMSVAAALAEIATIYTTKGGQGAIAGWKQQRETGLDTFSSNWDDNPDALAGSNLAVSPGATFEAFKTQGAGLDPNHVKVLWVMACMVFGVPPTFIGDLETSNLATATSLDRPTETGFLEKQEAWIEDLNTIASYVLKVSLGATKGKLREVMHRRKVDPADVVIREARRESGRDGRKRYVEAAKTDKEEAIEPRTSFPAIREGDIPQLVTAVVDAMTLGNRGGQCTGIDQKEGTRKLGDIIGLENNDEIIEEMFPEGEYDPDRTTADIPAPVEPLQKLPGGAPEPQPAQEQVMDGDVKESLKRLKEALRDASDPQ